MTRRHVDAAGRLLSQTCALFGWSKSLSASVKLPDVQEGRLARRAPGPPTNSPGREKAARPEQSYPHFLN